VFIVPFFGGAVASFASDTFGCFREWEVCSEFRGGVVAGEAVLKSSRVLQISTDDDIQTFEDIE